MAIISETDESRWHWLGNVSHFQKAIGATIVLHLVLLALLPPLPIFNLSDFDGTFDANTGLVVTLLKERKESEFNSSLNQNLPLAADIDQVATPSLGAESVESSDDDWVSDQQDQADLRGTENSDQIMNGNLASQDNSPSVRFDFAAIHLFAKQDAIRYAEFQPRKVERFARTFNRSRSNYRRNKSKSYRDQIGDIYARSNSSRGDVCFKKKRENAQSEFITSTVYFFRCDRKPIGFDLPLDKKNTSKRSG